MLNSGRINADVLCLILSAGIAACHQPETMAQPASQSVQAESQTAKPCGHDIKIIGEGPVARPDTPPCEEPQETSEERTESNQAPRHFVWRNDLVDVPAPTRPLRLAEANDVDLVIKAPGLNSVRVLQNRKPAGNVGYNEGLGMATLPVLHHPDGSTYIRFVPMGLGQIELTIDGKFVDDAFFRKIVTIEVEASERRPARLTVGPPSFDPSKMFLFIHGHPTPQRLTIFAVYDDVKEPIRIDASDGRFNIRTNDENPPFEIDPSTGIFKPLHTGHALLETSFGGASVLTCVAVEESGNAIDSGRYDHSHCEELYKPGEEVVKPKPFVQEVPH